MADLSGNRNQNNPPADSKKEPFGSDFLSPAKKEDDHPQDSTLGPQPMVKPTEEPAPPTIPEPSLSSQDLKQVSPPPPPASPSEKKEAGDIFSPKAELADKSGLIDLAKPNSPQKSFDKPHQPKSSRPSTPGQSPKQPVGPSLESDNKLTQPVDKPAVESSDKPTLPSVEPEKEAVAKDSDELAGLEEKLAVMKSEPDPLKSLPPSETKDDFSPPLPPSSPPEGVSAPQASFPEGEPANRLGNKYLWVGLAVVLVLLGLFFFLRRGKNSSGGVSGPVTLTYWGLWEPAPAIQGLIAQFEEKNPGIKVEYRKHSKNDYKTRLQNSLVKGEGPDIFRLHRTWLPMFAGNLSLVPKETEDALGLGDNYFPVVADGLKLNNKYYAVPLMVDTLSLYYNKDILKLAQKSLPKTWWGLEKAARELTVRDESGRIQTAGAALGTVNNVDHWSDIIGLMIYQDGADPARPDQAMVEDILSFYTVFYLKDKVWDETLPNSTFAFATNKVAFYFAPSWRYFNLKEINPDLNFGISVVPQLPEAGEVNWEAAEAGEAELTDINWASFWVEAVSAKSKHPQQAWQFLEFLASQESLKNLYAAQSQLRDFGEIYPVKQLAQTLSDRPALAPFVAQAQTARSWYLSSFTYDDSLNDGMIKYYEDAVNAIIKGDSPEGIAETLSSGVGQILTRYQISP